MREPDPSDVNALGQVHVYTGDAKGKTTACMGLALRAAGHGFRVYVGQFMKERATGEIVAARERLPDLIVTEQYGREGFVMLPGPPRDEDYTLALGGLARAGGMMRSGRFHMVILDEVLVAVSFGLIAPWVLVDFIRARPSNVELILSGRGAHPAILQEASLVTELRMVKHYFEKGVPSRKGIEE